MLEKLIQSQRDMYRLRNPLNAKGKKEQMFVAPAICFYTYKTPAWIVLNN